MRILLLCHGFNSASQRVFIALSEAGHEVSVEFDINDVVTTEAIELWNPDVLVAPFLKRKIPKSIWQRLPCLVVHPGPIGDAGPASLDHAILESEKQWGVTVFQADGDYDAGPIWAERHFPVPFMTKSSLYRRIVAPVAAEALVTAVSDFAKGIQPQRRSNPPVFRGVVSKEKRCIDWQQMGVSEIIQRFHAADSRPGVLEPLLGNDGRLFNAWKAKGLTGSPGEWVARCGRALARACADGVLWIGNGATSRRGVKRPLPALLPALAEDLPHAESGSGPSLTRQGGVAILHVDELNGAWSADASKGILQVLEEALSGPERVIVIAASGDHFCNGIDLCAIEAEEDPGAASLRAIEAIDDICQTMLSAVSHFIIAAVEGDAGAGGAFLPLCCDQFLVHRDCVLNPHYRGMGGLYGSEFWTYSLPRRCDATSAEFIKNLRNPISAQQAVALGFADRVVDGPREMFMDQVMNQAQEIAESLELTNLLAQKAKSRSEDEGIKPLAQYRKEEIQEVSKSFFGFDPSYHLARHDFVYRVPQTFTPRHLARHRQ